MLERDEAMKLWLETQAAFYKLQDAEKEFQTAKSALEQFDRDRPASSPPTAVRDFSDLLDWTEARDKRAADRHPLDSARYEAEKALQSATLVFQEALRQLPHNIWYRIDRYRVKYIPNAWTPVMIGDWSDDLLDTSA